MEAKITTLEFPRFLRGRGIEDPELLQWWNALGVFFLTSDSNLTESHARFIPNKHKGIVVICNGGRVPLDHDGMTAVISSFKRECGDWETLSLDNAVLELWGGLAAYDISVCRVLDGHVQWEEYFSYADASWKDSFKAALLRARAN